jgi:F-box-like
MFPLPRVPQAMATSSVVDLGNNLLPNEILGAIFDYLSPDALTRVALVSRRWRANAERVLYSTIILHEVLPHASSPSLAFATGRGPPAAELEPKKDRQTTTTTTRMTTTIPILAMPAVPITTLRCCETLSAHPHLAQYVRRFHLRWETDAVESPLFLLRIAHHIARTLVPTLVHLDSLQLSFDLAPHFLQSITSNNNNNSYAPPPQTPLNLEHSPPSESPPSPHARKSAEQQQLHQQLHQLHLLLLPPISLPSLRTLSLRGIGTPPSHELERILRNHSNLLHLQLNDYHRALVTLTPTDIPNLRSFRGHPATAASIIPGRPVQALSLVGGGSGLGGCESAATPTEEDLARIAAGSIPVRALDLSGMSVTPTLLRNVSRHLSHVEWLKVRLALRHTLHYALSGIVRHVSLTPYIHLHLRRSLD